MSDLPPQNGRPNGETDEAVRRQVAAQLLSGLLASGDYLAQMKPPPRELAIDAVELADALLQRLREEKG